MKPRIAIPHPSSDPAYVAKVMPQYRRAVEMAGGEAVEIALDLDNHEIARLATTCDGVLLPGCRADVNPEKYGAPRDPHTAPADARRDNADELLLQDAYNMRKPLLGICFGLQSLNVWRTGTLRQHLATGVRHSGNNHAPAPPHRAVIDPTSRLAEIVADIAAGTQTYHPERSEAEPRDLHFIELVEAPPRNAKPETRNGVLEFAVNSSHHQAADLVGDGLRAVAWCPDDQVIEAIEGTAPDHFVLAVQWHPERMLGDDPVSRAIFRALLQAARLRREHPRTSTPDFESAR